MLRAGSHNYTCYKLFSKMLAPSGLTKLEDILTIGHALFCADDSEVWAIDKLFEEAVFLASSSPPAILSPLVTDSEMGEKRLK